MRKRYTMPLIALMVFVGFIVMEITDDGEKIVFFERQQIELSPDDMVDMAIHITDDKLWQDLVQHPEKYLSQPIAFSGTAFHVVERGMKVFNGFGSPVNYIVVLNPKFVDGSRVLEGDEVTVYGLIHGIFDTNSFVLRNTSIYPVEHGVETEP